MALTRRRKPDRRGAFPRLLPLLLLLGAPAVPAQPPAPAGGPEAAGAPEAASAPEAARELRLRRRAVERIRSERGPFDPGLLEAYADLAAFQAGAGDHEGARDAYRDALQVARVGSGPYGAAQLPPLAALIEASGRLEDWAEVDGLVHLEHHVSRRLYGPADDRYLRAAQRYGVWKLRLAREDLLERGGGRLRDVEELAGFYEELTASLDGLPDVDPRRRLELLYGQARAGLMLARTAAATPSSRFEGTASPYVTETRCRIVRLPNGQARRECRRVQVANPRYLESQRDAKQMAVARRARDLERVLGRLRAVRDGDNGLSGAERARAAERIGRIEGEAQAAARAGRRAL